MPRPKSEITGQQGFIGIRLTEAQRKEYKRLGGPAWLRKVLAESINKKYETQSTNAEGAKAPASNPQTTRTHHGHHA
jgi:hypothetical protein